MLGWGAMSLESFTADERASRPTPVQSSRSRLAALVAAAWTLGCGAEPRPPAPTTDVTVSTQVRIHSSQPVDDDPETGDFVMIEVKVGDWTIDRLGILSPALPPAFAVHESTSLAIVPAWLFPVGVTHTKLEVVARARPGARATTLSVDADIDRPALAPRARITTNDIACQRTAARVCVGELNPDVLRGVLDVAVRAPPATKVSLLGQTLLAKDDAPARMAIEARDLILSTPFGEEVPVPIEITSPDGLVESVEARFVLRTYDLRMEDVASHPLKVAGEPDDVGPSRGVLLEGKWLKRFGAVERLADLELIAIVSDLAPREHSCGTYRNDTTGEAVELSNLALDQEVVVYERKTAKVRARKTFRASMPACPRRLEATYTGVKGEVATAAVEAYVASFVGR